MSIYDRLMTRYSGPAAYGRTPTAHTAPSEDYSPLYDPAQPRGINDTRGRSAMETRYIGRDLMPAEGERKGRADYYSNQTDQYLSNPDKIAGLFGPAYERAGAAIAAPAQRDFVNTQAGLQGNIASRFGGNASSVEEGALAHSGDIFSRNLTEALARLAPEQVGQGLQFTGQVAQQGQQSREEEDRIRQMILQALQGVQEKPKSGVANFLGGVAGTAAGALIP